MLWLCPDLFKRAQSPSVNFDVICIFISSGLVNGGSCAGSDVWIGAHQSPGNSALYYWTDGSTFSYQNWAAGRSSLKNVAILLPRPSISAQPLSNYQCVAIRGSDDMWKTADCSTQSCSLCETPPQLVTTVQPSSTSRTIPTTTGRVFRKISTLSGGYF